MGKKSSIIRATRELIVEYGINELTTAKIAERAGTAETIIYRNFKNKQDIINQAISAGLVELREKLETIAIQPLSAIVKLDRILEAHLEYNEKTKGSSRLAFSEQFHLGDPTLKQIAKTHLNKLVILLTEIIRDGIKEGTICSDIDCEMAAQSYIALSYFTINRWSFDDFSWRLLDEKNRIFQYWLKVWS